MAQPLSLKIAFRYKMSSISLNTLLQSGMQFLTQKEDLKLFLVSPTIQYLIMLSIIFYEIDGILVWFGFCSDPPKRKSEEEKVYLTYSLLSIIKRSQGRSWRQEPKQSSRRRAVYHLFLPCSAAFLMQDRPACLRRAVNWALLHQ